MPSFYKRGTMDNSVLIIDDDKDICALLRRFLEAEHFSAVCVHTGTEGLKEASRRSYQLIILDVMLPETDGFEVLKKLRETSNVPVLMLTAKDGDADKISGLRIGADDYITKPFNISELVARAQSLVRRYTVLNGEHNRTLEYGGINLDSASRTVYKDGQLLELTAKEFDLLFFLMLNRDKVFTKKQIYNAVWDDEYAYDDNNVTVHVRRLRKKIEDDPDEPKLIRTVWGVGYKFGGEI